MSTQVQTADPDDTMSTQPQAAEPDDRIPFWMLTIRLLWIAVQILLVLWFGQEGSHFLYQGF